MGYLIEINYVSSETRAGKLTLRNTETNEKVLNNVPVAVPYSILKEDSVLNFGYLSIEKKSLIIKDEIKKDPNLESDIKDAEKFKLNDFLLINKKIPILQTDNLLLRTNDSYMLMKNDFEVLKSCINNNDFQIKNNKKFFMFGLSEVGGVRKNIIQSMDKIENAQLLISDIKTINKNSNPSKSTEKNEQNVSKIIDNLAEAKNRENSQKIKQVEVPKKALPKEKVDTNSIKNNVHSNYYDNRNAKSSYYDNRNDSGLDAFDVVLMYQNPELAPLFRPTSLLAWALYFDHQKNDVSLVNMKTSVNEVAGFEDVAGTNIKYTSTGYEIAMYDDVNKNSLIGTLVYDSKTNDFTMRDPSGESKTTLNISDDGDVKGYVNGDKGTINYDLIKTPDGGYSGQWNSEDIGGMKINSSIDLSNNLVPESTPFESVNMDYLKTSRDEYIDEHKKSTEELEKNYTDKNDWKWEPPPPPPPPPPPKEDELGWSVSNDSYSNSSSFSP